MSEIKAGVVLVSKFCTAGATFNNYINYIDRNEAVRNENITKYNLYQDYMGNPEKTSGLFTAEKDNVTDDEKKNLKDIFKYAENNGSVMWQHVISFDNRWLKQQGLYNNESHIVDENRLKELTRLSMMKLQKCEGLENAVWSAAIHFNTDNIHIHIAMVEPTPMRVKQDDQVRGKIKMSSLLKAKSTIVNNILEHQPENQLINNIIRNNIIESKKRQVYVQDQEFARLFIDTFKRLPNDKRLWNYRCNGIKDIVPDLDKLSDIYINKYHAQDLADLQKLLKKQNDAYQTAYGKGKNDKSYYDGKMNDLHYRLGNVILKQMKQFDKEEKKRIYLDAKNEQRKIRQKDLEIFNRNKLRYAETQSTLKTAINITKMFMKSEIEKYKNELAHELLEQEIQLAEQEAEKEESK